MNNYNQRMDHGNEAYYNDQYGRGGSDNIYDPHYNNLRNERRRSDRRSWNEERDRNRDTDEHNEDRGFFERVGDRIRNTWNDWSGNDEDRGYREMSRQDDVRAGRDRDRDWGRARGNEGRIYNSDDYRTMGIRGGYIPEREMGNYLHDPDYDYGTGNYGAQGMGTTAYDQDFTYAGRGQNAGSANIRGRYFYDRNNEPVFDRDRRDCYDAYDHDRGSSHRDDIHNRSGRHGSRDDRYRGSNDREYRRDDYTMHGERAYFGNDAYGAGTMGGYHDNFPEDFRYEEWRRGTR